MAVAEEKTRRSLSSTQIAWAAFAGLVTLHVVLAVLLFDPKPFVGGDNAGYMILAESIESGQGYRNIHLPGAPRHAQYPPVYPTFLAAAKLFGGGLTTFKIFSLVFTTASLVFLFMLARRRLGWEGGPAVVAPFALSPVLLYYSHWVLSEALFVLLTLAALWAAERVAESWRWLATATAVAVLAYLTRAAGLPLLLALIVATAWRRDWRQLAVVGGAALAVIGGWWAWGAAAASDSAQVYSSNFLLVNPYAPELGYIGPGDLLTRVVNNVRLYAVDVLPQSLGGVAPGGGVNLIALLAALCLIVLALIAWVRDIRKVRPLECFTALYVALILLWPQVWTDRRFLLPLLPILLLHAAAGVLWCFDFLKTERRVWALPVLGALLVVLTIPDHVRAVGFSRDCMQYYKQGDRLACYPPPWRAFVQSADWVRENTPEDAIVVNRKPRLFYYFSGRRGDVYPFTTEDEVMLSFLDDIRADYVLITNVSGTTYRYLVPVIRSVPERFELEHTIGEGSAPAYVLRFRRSGAGTEEGRGD